MPLNFELITCEVMASLDLNGVAAAAESKDCSSYRPALTALLQDAERWTQAQREGRRFATAVVAMVPRPSQLADNLAGATWEQSISGEVQAVAAKYRAMNKSDTERQRVLPVELGAVR